MKKSSISRVFGGVIAISLAGMAPSAAVAAAQDEHADHAAMDHSKMDHSQHDTGRDALGRSLYGMKHQMTPEQIKELREKVALYKNYTDAEIALSMEMMGAEYAWYISPPELKGTQGLLILTHGFRDTGDKMFRERVQPMANIFPTSLGIGMAMMMSDHIEVALDDLVAAGAKEIVVVPVVSSATNELHRQWLYIFGKQEKPMTHGITATAVTPRPSGPPSALKTESINTGNLNWIWRMRTRKPTSQMTRHRRQQTPCFMPDTC